MVVQPVGPLPAATYWRRRAAALALLLLALLVLRLLFGSLFGGGGSGGKDTLTGSGRPTRSATPTQPAPTHPAPKLIPTPTRPAPARPAGTPMAAAGTCADNTLTVTSAADAASYPAGSSPRLSVTVRNKGPVGCRRDLGSGAVELVVSSGPDRIWSSDDCSPSKAIDTLVLAPGASRTVAVSWSGRRSRPGCAGGRERAQPGTYRVVGRVGTAPSAAGTFVLR